MTDRRHADSFARTLGLYRRRLQRAAFLRYCCIASVAAFSLLDAGLIVLRPDASLSLAGCAAALLVACVVASAWAWLRAPSAAATARHVDGYFRLDDCVVSGLQCSGAPDPMARLVIADAVARLRDCAASRLPFAIPLRWRTGAFCAAASAVLLALLLPLTQASGPATAADNLPAGTARVTTSGDSPAGATVRDARAGERGGVSLTPVAPDAQASPLPRGSDVGEEALNRPGTAEAGTRQDPKGAAVDGGSGAERAAAAARPPSGTAAVDGAGDRANARSGERGNGRGAPGDASSSGRATGIGARTGAGGGVAGGTPAGPGQTPSPTTSPARVEAAPYGNAVNAEAAIANGRVPPALRAYVRDYLLSIQPRTPGQ